MTPSTTPSPEGGGPRTLSAVLHDLDGAPRPGGVDLAGAVVAGTRLRRRRRTGAALAVVAAAVVLGLGTTVVGHGLATQGPSSGAADDVGAVASIGRTNVAELATGGSSALARGQIVTPGVPDEQRPLVYAGPEAGSITVVIGSGGCGGPVSAAVVGQTPDRLELHFTGRVVPEGAYCTADAYDLAYTWRLASPPAPGVTVILDLPWARGDSTEDVSGRAMGELDPGEVLLPVERTRFLGGRTFTDGSPVDQVFIDAGDMRVRLRFAFSVCATAALRPPLENDVQVILDVVVTDPGTTCQQPLYAEDFLTTLETPLGDREVIVREESRTAPTPAG